MALEGKVFDQIPYKNLELYIRKAKENTLASWPPLKQLIDNKQVLLIDKQYTLEELARILDTPELTNSIIFIDYLQIVPIHSTRQRYQEIKNIADTFRLYANKHKFLVVTGSQLTNGEKPFMDVAREGKDIYNAAEMVLRVWNKKTQEAHAGVNDHFVNIPGDFIIEVRKDRGGAIGKKFGFTMEGLSLNEYLADVQTLDFEPRFENTDLNTSTLPNPARPIVNHTNE